METLIDRLKHHLPAQAPLKDFIHHNTLHAFQHMNFHDGLRTSAQVFGNKTYLSLDKFRTLLSQNKISSDILKNNLRKEFKGEGEDVLNKHYDTQSSKRVGSLRDVFKRKYAISLDEKTHPLLFRVLCQFLDQGISIWRFPHQDQPFLESLRRLDKNSMSTLFFRKNGRARRMLQEKNLKIEDLLKILVGDPALYERYLFDQQFAHPGWSGLVTTIEELPQSLLSRRKITLSELIVFELLLEIDYLDSEKGEDWPPLNESLDRPFTDLFAPSPEAEIDRLLKVFQNSYEQTYYADILKRFKPNSPKDSATVPEFQAMFCIDDRECSFRRHIENLAPAVETLSAPGFFGVAFYYQPENSHFVTKLCPAPLTPKHLIKQLKSQQTHKTDFHFEHETHSFVRGWMISQTLGYWSAFKLFLNIFKPSLSPATATSLRHMDKVSRLTVENEHIHNHEHGLQIGFTLAEMADRIHNLLKSVGLTQNFSPLVYLVGHGSSSVNNPHYSAYDCGACSGRPGSVNARVAAHMANHPGVRSLLSERGVSIPRTTRFIGALHDTTRDEMEFFDDELIPLENNPLHRKALKTFQQALALNAQERSLRFENIDSTSAPEAILEKVRLRSVSLFEPRPELNHATNALCIVAPRHVTRDINFERRAFLNSYDPLIDPDGEILTQILSAAIPVCGGINLEYYFSRVDNQKLGAGTKLPHNVMGLVGVANGIEGDLRTGLPSQMIEVHDPIRLLMVVYQTPEVALKAVLRNPATAQWVQNEWIIYCAINPQDQLIYMYDNGRMVLSSEFFP